MLCTGDVVPDFTAEVLTPAGDFAVRRLSECGAYVVLVFYPADFSFVCPTEVAAFSAAAGEFAALGAELLLGSTDSAFCHFAFSLALRRRADALCVPLFSD